MLSPRRVKVYLGWDHDGQFAFRERWGGNGPRTKEMEQSVGILTLTADTMRKLAWRNRLRDEFVEGVRREALDEFQVLLARGNSVFAVCTDRGFAPLPDDTEIHIPEAPLSALDVARELDELLLLSGKPNLTLALRDMYRLTGRERLRDDFLELVRTTALDEFQIIVARGRFVFLVCHDRNFGRIEYEEEEAEALWRTDEQPPTSQSVARFLARKLR